MTADVTRRTWSNPSAEVLAASSRDQSARKQLEAARELLREQHAAISTPLTGPQAAQLQARVAAFLATT